MVEVKTVVRKTKRTTPFTIVNFRFTPEEAKLLKELGGRWWIVQQLAKEK